MRLIELTANQDTFRTVRFNPTGLSLVVGKQSDPMDKSRDHSTNGVGKSLLLYLISFCLGSDSNRQLKEKLPEWEFTLAYDSFGIRHSVTRNTANQAWLVVDGKKMSLKAFRQELGREFFGIDESIKWLSYRFLLGLFFRQGKPAYISEAKTFDRETPFQSQLRGSYLLGLDESLPLRKLELQEERERLELIRSQFRKDSLLRDYFFGNRDASLELADLDDSIALLKKNAVEFKVADNYDEMAKEAEETRRKWQRARNDLNAIEASLRQIDSSLTVRPDISPALVQEMYSAAQVQLPDVVRRKLSDVQEFHRELVESRTRRLTAEKHKLERLRDSMIEEIRQLSVAKDEYFRFLGTHGALQEYEALHGKLAELQRRAERLREFRRLEQECTEKTQQNKLEMSRENIRATDYLKAARPLTDQINDRFRAMARRIWPNHTCGLTIRNNEGENKTRFEIDARIQGDASDGIGESRIFCFDMTVLFGQKNHKMQVLMHDNRLYSGIDPRQCAEVFRVAHELCREHDMQYIASIGESNLLAMREKMRDEDEFKTLFADNVVLELTDDSDRGKLLGITVDLVYESAKKQDE
ncbi:MAG: DUF2326 domain-containing protein [Planctomycetaceae bacterium]